METKKFDKFPIHEFMGDIGRILREGGYLYVLALFNDDVQIVTHPVSLTVYGNRVENPERYIDILNDLKDQAIKNLIKNNLPLVRKYMDAHSDTKEAQFLYELINRLNTTATSKDYYNILMLAKNAVAQLPAPVSKQSRFRKLSWTDPNSEYRQACNQIIDCMEKLIAECLVFEYPTDSKGQISTPAFEKWNNSYHLDAAAIKNPGATINDIIRDVKVGEKGILNFDFEIIQDDAKIQEIVLRRLNKMLVEIKDPEMLKGAAELLGMSTDEINHGKANMMHLQNMIMQDPFKGNAKAEELVKRIIDEVLGHKDDLTREAGYKDPGHFKEKRLIKILRALDDGLMLGDAYAKVYQEYEHVYDLCQKLQADYPQSKHEIDEILRAANALLLAHSRDYAELVKNDYGYQIKEPKVIINQVKHGEAILQKNLDKLMLLGVNGAFELEILVKKFLQERAEVVKKYPEKVAVKEELLSVKQNVQNDLYLTQVLESFSLKGRPIAPAAPEMQNTAIVFDGKGGASIQLEVQQGMFASEGNMIAMNENSHIFQIETGKETRQPDLLTLQMKVHFAAAQDARAEKGKVPEVAVSLTELKFTRGSIDLEFTPKGGKAVDDDLELKSRSRLNSGA